MIDDRLGQTLAKFACVSSIIINRTLIYIELIKFRRIKQTFYKNVFQLCQQHCFIYDIGELANFMKKYNLRKNRFIT